MDSNYAGELCTALEGVARKAWSYRGRVFVAVARSRLDDLKLRVDVARFVVDRSDASSVVLKSRECVSDSWSARRQVVENGSDPFVRAVGCRQVSVINLLLSAHPTGVSDEEERLLSELEGCISFERRLEIEDELDRFKSHDLSVPEGYAGHVYGDERAQGYADINRKLSDWQWRKCEERQAEQAPDVRIVGERSAETVAALC